METGPEDKSNSVSAMQVSLPSQEQQPTIESTSATLTVEKTVKPHALASLRFKVISIVGLAFSIIFLGQLSVARILLLGRFAQLEAEQAGVNAQRMRNALNTELARLNLLSRDYAAWDDTYEFVETEDSEYIDSNLVNSTFSDGEVNVFAIANSSGQLVFGKGFDLEKEEATALPNDLLELVSGEDAFLSHPNVESSIVGIVTLAEGPMLVASQPILTSNAEGPVRGSLLFGRFLDRALVQELGELTEFPVTLTPYNALQSSPRFQAVVGAMLEEDELTAFQVLDENTIASYAQLNDLQDRPVFVLSTELPRDIFARGQDGFTFYLWTTLAMGVAFCTLILLVLDRLVLNRLSRLSQDVTAIGDTGNISRRVEHPGQDELSNLAKTINWTLSCLESSQQALRESEERYALSVSGANDGLWDWNLRSGDIYLSPRWKSIVGYADNELSNAQTEWFDLVHPEDLENLKATISSHRNSQTEQLKNEHRLHHKDGSYRWVLCRGLAVRDESGEAYRMAGSLTDITDRKLASETLARQAEELARSNTELEQFAYVASHDLQEPLRKIQAFGDRLNSKFASNLDERGRDYLARMQAAAKRMQTLIQDLLKLSRVTSQAQPFITVNLSEIVDGVLTDLEIRIQETNATLDVGALPTLRADPSQMRQLFQNTIGNALKFARPDQPPVVTVSSKRCQAKALQTGVKQDVYQISISDNGIGFDEKYCDRIFDIFQRLHGRNEYEGSGIGLAVCTKIVERHGGSISACSQPGQGATFIVTLPAI